MCIRDSVHTLNDPVRGILLTSDRESLLRELDIAVPPCQLRTERKQARIVRRQTQVTTDHLAQLGAVLCHWNPHVLNLLDIRNTEAVIRRDERGVARDRLFEVAHGCAT